MKRGERGKAGLRYAAATHNVSKRFTAQPIPISICIVQAVPSGLLPKTILELLLPIQAMTNSDLPNLIRFRPSQTWNPSHLRNCHHHCRSAAEVSPY